MLLTWWIVWMLDGAVLLCVCLQSGSGAVSWVLSVGTLEMDMRGTLFRTASWGQTAGA